MPTIFEIIIASILVSSISLTAGAFLIFQQKKRSGVHWQSYLVSFAAGIMLTTAFIDVLPEAFSSSYTPSLLLTSTFLGVLVFFFLERFMLWFHHHHEPHATKPTNLLILLGDGIHNAIDGIAIAAAFLTSPAAGIATTLAISAHEIPQELSDFSLLIVGGMRPSQALIWNFVSGLTALVGAILGYFFLQNIQQLVPLFLAFTAGMFIYIACSDLIPDLHQEFKTQKNWKQTIPFILGTAVLWILARILEP